MRIKKAGGKVFGVDVEAWNKERKEPDETEKH